MRFCFLLFVTLHTFPVFADDQGFRYQDGQCLNSEGQVGLNPDFLGECGNLENRDLKNETLNGLNLKGAILKGSTTENQEIKMADLEGANLAGAQWNNVDLTGSRFVSANLNLTRILTALGTESVDFSQANLAGADLSGSDLFESNFSGATLDGTQFNNSILFDSSFAQSSGSGISMIGSDCSFCTFNGVDFTDADLSSSNLSSATLQGAEFVNTNWRASILTDTQISESQFNSNLMHGILLDRSTIIDSSFEGASMRQASIRSSTFAGVNLSQAGLRAARFDFSTLESTDFTGADLIRTELALSEISENSLLADARFSSRTTLPFPKEMAMSKGMLYTPRSGMSFLTDVSKVSSGLRLNMQAILNETEGLEVTTIDDSSTGLMPGTSELPEKSLLLIPPPSGDLSETLNLEQKQELVQFVQEGGTLILAGGSNSRASINGLFGYTLSLQLQSIVHQRLNEVIGDYPFENPPNSLGTVNGSFGLLVNTLPENATALYGNGDRAGLVHFKILKGDLYYIAWDYLGSAPIGSQDGKWPELLKVMLRALSY